jgi:hypothetical protein
MADDHDSMTPDQIRELHEWQEAFKQEFAESTGEGAEGRKVKKEKLEDQMVDLIPDAVAALKHDIKFAPKPEIKQKAYLFLLNAVRDDAKRGSGANDPLKRFLEGLEEKKDAPVPDA